MNNNTGTVHGRVVLYEIHDNADSVLSGSSLEKEWPANMAHRIEKVTARVPERIALGDGHDETFTYTEMSDRVQDLTNALIQSGVKPSEKVAMYYAGHLPGWCYLRFLEYACPNRTACNSPKGVQLADIVHHRETLRESSLFGFATVPRLEASAVPRSSVFHPIFAQAEDAAVIIHASGTTGEPKGISLSHEGLCNTLELSSKTWVIEAEVVLQQTAFSFDACHDQVCLAICNGIRLYVLSEAELMDSAAIVEQIYKRDITYTIPTLSEYRSWMANGNEELLRSSYWRLAYAVGEVLSYGCIEDCQALAKSDLNLYNGYGPAECTILASKHQISYANQDVDSIQEL
nr:polyketide synthase-nonribosomal peptide synthetase [Quercus suber]